MSLDLDQSVSSVIDGVIALQREIHADPEGWPELPHHAHWGRFDLSFLMRGAFAVPESFLVPGLEVLVDEKGTKWDQRG